MMVQCHDYNLVEETATLTMMHQLRSSPSREVAQEQRLAAGAWQIHTKCPNFLTSRIAAYSESRDFYFLIWEAHHCLAIDI